LIPRRPPVPSVRELTAKMLTHAMEAEWPEARSTAQRLRGMTNPEHRKFEVERYLRLNARTLPYNVRRWIERQQERQKNQRDERPAPRTPRPSDVATTMMRAYARQGRWSRFG